jgi:hypothetical protein
MSLFNQFFTTLFAIECFMKIVALGRVVQVTLSNKR